MINPERRTITPFEPSSDVCQAFTASLKAGQQPPYLGSVVDAQKGHHGVFLSDGAYCVEDPYGTWDALQKSKPWFRMNFERPNESHAESSRIVGNCIVLGRGPASRDYDLRDATITIEELVERVHWHSPSPQQTATQTTPM
jgi:hypothetical protein